MEYFRDICFQFDYYSTFIFIFKAEIQKYIFPKREINMTKA